MKLYKTTVKNALDLTARWAGSQTEATKHRKEFGEAGFKRSEVETQTVDVPTHKDGLLEWLNKNVKE